MSAPGHGVRNAVRDKFIERLNTIVLAFQHAQSNIAGGFFEKIAMLRKILRFDVDAGSTCPEGGAVVSRRKQAGSNGKVCIAPCRLALIFRLFNFSVAAP